MTKTYYVLKRSKDGMNGSSKYDTYEEAYEALTMDYWEPLECDKIYKVVLTETEMPIKCPYEKELNKILETEIDGISMSTRLRNALHKNNIYTLKDIYVIPYEETKKLEGIGKKTFEEELKVIMLEHGIAMDFNKQDIYVWHYNKKLAKQILENRRRRNE